MAWRRNRIIGITIAAIAVVTLAAQHSAAQLTPGQLRSVLVQYAGFTEADLAAMDNGEIIVRPVKTANKQDVAVFGIVQNSTLPQFTMTAFRDSLSQKGNKEMEAKGRFSDPPKLNDLDPLVLEDRDFEELRKCKVGDCDINMSANWIKRFNSEIDWNAIDYRQRATELFRSMVLEYAVHYASNGVASLGTLVNRKKPLNLAASHRELLNDLVLIETFAPGLREYVQEFPKGDLSGAQNELHWSAVDFGLNPTVTLTHAAVLATAATGNDQHFVVTRQFYSTRYLDASISLTALLRIPNGETTESYIIFTDRSRSDALDGMFSGVARGVVENEAVTRITEVIKNSELRLLNQAAQQNNPTPADERTSGDDLEFLNTRVLIIAAVAFVVLVVFVLIIRNKTRK